MFSTGWSKTQPGPAHGHYWMLPAAAAVFWLATILGLLLWWAIDDHAEQYEIDETTVVFISNVGGKHQALFIPGCALTFVFLTASLVMERLLRHWRRIPGSLKKRETSYDIVAVVFGTVGGLALLLLSIFDCFNHANAHWSLTAIFVVCIAVSAAFQTAEVMMLERDHVERRHLRRNAIIKLVIVSLAIAGAICFGGTYGGSSGKYCPSDAPQDAHCNLIGSVAAVFEWAIALLFDFYLWTLVLDLWPAHKTVGHAFHDALIGEDKNNTLHHHTNGTAGQPGGIGMDSNRTSLSYPQTAHTNNTDNVMRQV